MSWFSKLFGQKKEVAEKQPAGAPKAEATQPAVPQNGRIFSFSVQDATGRIRLEDGTELRFGGSSWRGRHPPKDEQEVRVLKVERHPLGGFKSSEVVPLSDDVAPVNVQRAPPPAGAWDPETQPAPIERAEEAADPRHTKVSQLAQKLTGVAYLKEVLSLYELEASDLNRIIALARPTARLEIGEPADEWPIGATRFGGSPDVPADFKWPTYKGSSHEEEPLSFLLQIQLSDVPAEVREPLSLPAAGLLSFFYDAVGQPWGFDPDDVAATRVFFTEPTRELIRTPTPGEVSADRVFSKASVHFISEMTLPRLEDASLLALGLSEDSMDTLRDAFEAIDVATGEVSHQFGGHPNPVQGSMEEECSMVHRGIYTGNEIDRTAPEVVAAINDAASWRMLLQLDSDDDLGIMWGDVGRLYFWAHADDLRALKLDKVQCILQCH